MRAIKELWVERRQWVRRLKLAARAAARGRPCLLCGGDTRLRWAYARPFHQCRTCQFIFTRDFTPAAAEAGDGLEGSWSGPGGGGHREYFLASLLRQDFGKRSFLLYGTGNTPTFERLRQEGVDVVGCDITPGLVRYKQQQFGADAFCHSASLPERRFDAIIAVEVFEHLDTPLPTLATLAGRLEAGGVICGTTNFFLGGPIQDSNEPGYMSHEMHVAYWSHRSLSHAAQRVGLQEIEFQMERPGSVFPDEKYGQLWPNKRVFFLCQNAADYEKLTARWNQYPILPIRQP